ncbi:MAG: hypothetical protein ACYTEZ_17250 [Planctomycetota bacterium]
MSHASASLLLVVVMFGLAIYFLFAPPPGFGESLGHRITIPFLLVASAYMVLENLRTRTHISQLVGALRSLMGRSGTPPTPKIKREAVEILLKSLRAEKESVRQTAARQLRQLTGQRLGDAADEWEQWWAANKESFGRTEE